MMSEAWAERTVRVGVYQNSPKVAVAEDGGAEGMFVDLIEAIAEEEGWSLEYVPGTWVEGLDRLLAGEIDLMPDVAYSAAREETYAFHHEPVLSDWFQVYARRGSGIKSIVDCAGGKISVLERSIQQDAFARMLVEFDIMISLMPFSTYEDAFAAVARGEADAVIANRFYGATHLREHQLEDTAIIFSPTRLFFAAPKSGDPMVRDAIDRHLARFKRDPHSVYFRSLKRWTSEAVPARVPGWMKGAVIGTIGVLLVVGLWTVTLKRQIAVRTAELRRSSQENARLYTEVRRRAENLEGRVAERTAELTQANTELAVARDQAQAADRLKSAFLATMSHELRTPLNSIIGFTGILLQELPGPLTTEQRTQLEMVRGSARHLLALINDVLDISKIEAGQMEVVRESFDLRASLAKVAGIMRPLAEKKGLAVRLDCAPEIGLVEGDPRRVEQVLMNLMNNAVKFTEQGAVTVTAGVREGWVRIAVADTGIGIKPQDLSTLFRPFRQIDTGLSRQHEGTGLGLAICTRLVDLMGGDITVESAWERGSVFTFALPIHAGGMA